MLGPAAWLQKVFHEYHLLVFFLAFLRFSRHTNDDPLKCQALLNHGLWLDAGLPDSYQNWQPPGCMMREYRREDIKDCFKGHRLVLIGDSTVRDIFWAIARILDSKQVDRHIADTLRAGNVSTYPIR